ncbi:MAG: hypothetical protein KME30_21220 [Iphinoe sp. HA4291-MV1]|jgi:hypothetical protein|nr:hypothetical protein [Iphinoe sp. HA4291-MV1]
MTVRPALNRRFLTEATGETSTAPTFSSPDGDATRTVGIWRTRPLRVSLRRRALAQPLLEETPERQNVDLQGYFVVIGTATLEAVCSFALFTMKQAKTSISTKS